MKSETSSYPESAPSDPHASVQSIWPDLTKHAIHNHAFMLKHNFSAFISRLLASLYFIAVNYFSDICFGFPGRYIHTDQIVYRYT